MAERPKIPNGMLFYVHLLAISFANILVPVLAPTIYTNWLASPQRVLHSVLATRVLLLIRGQSQRASPFESGTQDLVALWYLPATLSSDR
ncbi:hypothetical protein DFH06DRAFT_1406146 [Mycena polygramma]|nr:hypothetical protein DFH06DRAFT_1406146 [Mycena polygramma]